MLACERTQTLKACCCAVQEGVILDTYQLMDPDLISIGAGTTLAENVVVSAAFVAPAGFADKGG